MKNHITKMLGIMSFALTSTTSFAQEHTMTHSTASYIPMTAAANQTDRFAAFLTGAAPLVKETEPGTALWFALQGADNTLAIFDVFVDANARDAHFAGVVAGALNENASTLVEGGWNDGVVANINNSHVLSVKAPVDLYSAKTATYIKLTAAPGKGESLAELLTAAGPIVADTEPKTVYWVALRLDQDNFALFDIFADESGREAHFAGQVANLLKEKSAELVAGGWEKGVLPNIAHYDILAIK